MDGDVFLDLKFDPEINGNTVDLKATAPKVFQIMSELACHYLFVTGFVDENGELHADVAQTATVN